MEGQVRAFLADLEAQRRYSLSTRLAYDNDLRCFVAYLQQSLGRQPQIQDFHPQSVADFLKAERECGRRASTILRRRASIRRFAAFLEASDPAWGEIFSQSMHLIDDAVTSPAPDPRQRYLTDEQVETLWALMERSPRPRTRRDHAILALLLESGLTVGALIALNLPDVNMQMGKLRLCLETGEEFWLTLGRAHEPLCRYIEEGRPELNYHPNEPALFISQTGGRMSRQGVWQVLRQWGYKAGIPVTISPRLVRHTAAYRLVRSGRSLVEVQALLGHTNPLSTQALMRRLAEHPVSE
jgi:integrase/recombinase XerD